MTSSHSADPLTLLCSFLPVSGTESLVLGHPGWSYVITHLYPGDMFLYLVWLRTTIAVTFAQLCFDAMAVNRIVSEVPAEAAAEVGVPVGVGAPAASEVSAQRPSKAATPTIVQLESVPPSSKVQVTMETPPGETKQSSQSATPTIRTTMPPVKEEEEIKHRDTPPEPLPTPS
jgi:hypothetical protein